MSLQFVEDRHKALEAEVVEARRPFAEDDGIEMKQLMVFTEALQVESGADAVIALRHGGHHLLELGPSLLCVPASPRVSTRRRIGSTFAAR